MVLEQGLIVVALVQTPPSEGEGLGQFAKGQVQLVDLLGYLLIIKEQVEFPGALTRHSFNRGGVLNDLADLVLQRDDG